MAISTNITWNIIDLKRQNSDGFVYEIRYSITGDSIDDATGEKHQHVVKAGHVVPDQTRTGSEISFTDLTEDKIIEWVKTALGSTEVTGWENIIKGHLIAMHDGSLNRPNDGNDVSNGLPWT